MPLATPESVTWTGDDSVAINVVQGPAAAVERYTLYVPTSGSVETPHVMFTKPLPAAAVTDAGAAGGSTRSMRG